MSTEQIGAGEVVALPEAPSRTDELLALSDRHAARN